MATVIRMPQLAAGGESAAVQAWLVEPGDAVDAGQTIVEIETEKAVVEYESEVTGVFAGTLVAAGDWITVGSPIAVIAAQGEALEVALSEAGGEPAAEPAPAAEATEPTPPEVSKGPAQTEGITEPATQATDHTRAAAEPREDRIFATPLVRRLAAERGIEVRAIPGSGPRGRITRRDLEVYVEREAMAATQESDAVPSTSSTSSTPRPAEPEASFADVPHTGMRRAIARRLTESKSTVPHFYLVADTRVDELLALRAQINEGAGVKISVNDFVLKAVAYAFKDVPDANAIWTDEATRRFEAVDLAVAVSVPNGLVTPVVRGVDSLSLGGLSAKVKDLADRTREGRVKQHELEGGVFAVSNLGMYGTEEFAAIINPPHAGILAVGAATKRPIVTDDGELGVGSVMTVTLSADHRVLDGALAAEWLAAFVKRIENPLSILL